MAFRKVLIANRGAIATRILRTLRRMGISPVAVFSEADRYSPHVAGADSAVFLGPSPAGESYLRIDAIIDAARVSGAEAIHPGYGFLSENADFAARCEAENIAFIGPTAQQMRDFGLKHTARALAAATAVPLLPGTGLLDDLADALRQAGAIGYPVMLKSTAGGGGIGMRRCASPQELTAAYDAVARLARANFRDAGLYLEKLVQRARHVEVQIFGDGAGQVIALGERDCSLQRRNQKVIEETPAPGLAAETRQAMLTAAVRLAAAARYRSAGTVEFVLDVATGRFYFLEVNTRIQVEHGVTEEVTGVDLIEWMVRLAAGDPPELVSWRPADTGAAFAIEARLYAEDPGRGFQPSCGTITELAFPDDIRVETWVEPGSEVTPYYDPMLAKLIARGRTREEAVDRLRAALAATRIAGVETNRAYLADVLGMAAFRAGEVDTGFLDGVSSTAGAIEVVEPGTQTTIQDFPGRLGAWDVGVPPSGPMDSLAFRLGNRLVGNSGDAAGLECTVLGPTLRFRGEAVVALTGADMDAAVDGVRVERYRAVAVPAGSILRLGAVNGAGSRAYLAVRGGLDVPLVLGSRSTFTLGRFGGHGGRALRAGDVLHAQPVAGGAQHPSRQPPSSPLDPATAPPLPSLSHDWTMAVLDGPHGAPDFFTPGDIEELFRATWIVHHNSNRTGVRLIGPRPVWARQDGGEAGLHPSNIHDTAYAVGTVDFTGDMPIILGPDGPSLGGFVCPATIVAADLWKVGQLRAGDAVRFRAVTLDEARAMKAAQEALIAGAGPPARDGTAGDGPRPAPTRAGSGPAPRDPVLVRLRETAARPSVTVRQDGDANILIEYGPMVLDLALRFRVHALAAWFTNARLPGIIDLTPGIRSLQVHHDDAVLPRERLLEAIARAEEELPATDAIEVPSRIVHLPLSWDDPATQLAIEKYAQSVRPDAPWCPSNIEFIRRINGLADADDVRAIVHAASYLVLGLGDVYLGAPVATPIDPRHRLVTTKYNPARTWTPENAVGIGGAYLCVYGMEGPGGYQFVGRTCQMWNRFHQTADFTDGKPWLLRFFDQIRFFPVSARELLAFREDFPRGRVKLRMEPTTFRLADYQRFLRDNQGSIDAFKRRQQQAFEAERERWALAPRAAEPASEAGAADGAGSPGSAEFALAPGEIAVRADVTGSVWQLLVQAGARVEAGERLLVLESMKMEIPVVAGGGGTVREIVVRAGAMVAAGQILLILDCS